MKKRENIITDERLSLVRAARREKRERFYAEHIAKLGAEATDELRRICDSYDERYYIWLASLWDCERGGFYAFPSGRDTEGYLPDLESTGQILRVIECSGLISAVGEKYGRDLPEKMKNDIIRFTSSLEDKDDGYFYHPQWGKDITVSRRGRDCTWACNTILGAFGAKAPYPTALDRLSGEDKPESVPEHFKSLSAYKQYLIDRNINGNSYVVGNTMQAQAPQILSAGPEYVRATAEWLSEYQKPNGLWEEQVNYQSVNGLMKLSLLCSDIGISVPNCYAALESAIFAALSDEPITFCCQFYNPLITISLILKNIEEREGAVRAEEVRAPLTLRAAELIRVTRRKLHTCMRSDGVFMYNTTIGGGYKSQGAAVAVPYTDEGGVNATTICLRGVMLHLCDDIGIPMVPIFCEEDGKLFFELIDNAEPIKKTNPRIPGIELK